MAALAVLAVRAVWERAQLPMALLALAATVVGAAPALLGRPVQVARCSYAMARQAAPAAWAAMVA